MKNSIASPYKIPMENTFTTYYTYVSHKNHLHFEQKNHNAKLTLGGGGGGVGGERRMGELHHLEATEVVHG
jgi:hypothetical protein